MKRFLIEIFAFFLLVAILIFVLLWFVPNKKIENNSLFSTIDKHKRLDSIQVPKIVFVGGSNLAFGLNSHLIQDSLKMPVVNMGLHAGFGLQYMLSEVEDKIMCGDIVIVAPEYQQFTDKMYLGEKVLVALLFDVNKKNLSYLELNHLILLTPQMINYGVSKIFYKKLDVMDDGGGNDFVRNFKRKSFNQYGDIVTHWNYPNEIVHPMSMSTTLNKVNRNSIQFLVDFKTVVESRGAQFILIPPSLQHSSFVRSIPAVDEIENKLKEQNLFFSINPSVFAYPDSLFFNTVYHLNKKGLDLRSQKIIELLKKKI